ncbi:hypothetical protein PATSB16_28810 [Pandoraea thiooxydans]|nr:hypothetical protein PATSB16_28810 [Pandoraea thiooxydans]
MTHDTAPFDNHTGMLNLPLAGRSSTVHITLSIIFRLSLQR